MLQEERIIDVATFLATLSNEQLAQAKAAIKSKERDARGHERFKESGLNVSVEDGTLIIKVPMNKMPKPSKSGNMNLYGSSGGFVTCPEDITAPDGKPLTINVIVGVKA